MYILGISYSMHDSAICLLENGKIVSAIEEERLDRKKHSENFPYKSIEYVLNKNEITINDIYCIGLNFRPSVVKREKLNKFALDGYPQNYMVYFGMKMWYDTLVGSKKILRNKIKYKGKILFIDHHMAHAASAFYSSPFTEALIITSDGTGEKNSMGIWKGKGNVIKEVNSNSYPNSLGLIYTFFSCHIGMGLNGEGKTMGLASYGEDAFKDFFDDLIRFTDNEIFELNNKYFNVPFGMLYVKYCFKKQAIDIIGEADLGKNITNRKKNLAASLQSFLERTMIRIVDEYVKKTGLKTLCLSGGVALNSALNGKLSNIVDNIFIHPAPNDSGTAIGVCQYIYYAILKNERIVEEFSPYIGPEYGEEEIVRELEKTNCSYKKIDNIEEVVAKKIDEGKVIGWFQGKMEFGPRALGNRSILADPRRAEMKDILNKKVKHRENFRPFAPVIKEETASDYFELKGQSPYMAIVAQVKKEKVDEIPAVVHVDGTARIQTVNRRQNEKLYNLLEEFDKLTNVPLLVNTSFNDSNEPIVCSPLDAINCFIQTEIDYLVMGNYLIQKVCLEHIQRNDDKMMKNVNVNNHRLEYYVKGMLRKLIKRSESKEKEIYYE